MTTERQKLVENNIKLVWTVLHKSFPSCTMDEDLVQAGRVGLCLAAENWKEDKGEFFPFAYRHIRGAILKELTYRYKHIEVLSLDNEVTNKDGDKSPLIDSLIGEEDVGYAENSVHSWFYKLTPTQKSVLELLSNGISQSDIARQLGISRQRVSEIKKQAKERFKGVS